MQPRFARAAKPQNDVTFALRGDGEFEFGRTVTVSAFSQTAGQSELGARRKIRSP
ncbi:MAG: hypothetical protein ACO1OB_21860 [Archangium sp.]